MKNLWVQEDRSFAEWSARCPRFESVTSAMSFLGKLQTVGEANGFRPRENLVETVDRISLRPWEQWCARLSYYSVADELIESEVCDLSAPLDAFCVEESEFIYSAYRRRGFGVVRLSGDFVRLEDEEVRGGSMQFILHSDIWFPYVRAYAHHRYNETDIYVRNDVLARLNTPRLNRFLSGLRSVFLEAGGSWSLSDGTVGSYLHWLMRASLWISMFQQVSRLERSRTKAHGGRTTNWNRWACSDQLGGPIR